MGKSKTIDAFFNKDDDSNSKMSSLASNSQTLALEKEQHPSKMPIIESVNISTLQRDPELRLQI
jgi:hypothetical protein